MKEQLLERIQILLRAEMIDKIVAEFCENVTDYILDAKPDADEEKLGMLITHLAMGIQRLIKNQEEAPVDNIVLDSVKQEPCFSEAEKLADFIILKCPVHFNKTESDFLKIHLCNLMA
ncbi:PRD domain-containing protein [Lacrimispora sp.]|uniref:PRD domain-containing protein n=1 Tax=Lacrimispora sp. TaxID=2719234 RepID=UPI0028990276|nr:PRD domain-containing protein [Lacrimispora sp.]